MVDAVRRGNFLGVGRRDLSIKAAGCSEWAVEIIFNLGRLQPANKIDITSGVTEPQLMAFFCKVLNEPTIKFA